MMNLILKSFISIYIVLVLVSAGYAVEPIELLKHAWDNEGTIRLYGKISTFGYFGARNVSSQIELYWFPPKKIRREFYADNQLRLVLVSDETTEWRYFPRRNIVVISELPTEVKMTPSRLQLLMQNYHIKSVGQEKILNRTADVIEIIPKYPGNPSRRIWVDIKQPIILRIEQFNAESKKISTSYFTELSFSKKIDISAFTIPSTVKFINQSNTFRRKYSIEQAEKELNYAIKTATYLPPGYIYEGCYLWQPRFRGTNQSLQLRYTDGLNILSIFEHPIEKKRTERDFKKGIDRQFDRRKYSPFQRNQGRDIEFRKHAEDTTREIREYFERQHGKIMRINVGSIQCIIIGDLPQKELQKIAQSLQ
ncbi:MAG: hypothetical protein N3A72_11395 [bacterium]|nr:hypothetical protein [bacterium]